MTCLVFMTFPLFCVGCFICEWIYSFFFLRCYHVALFQFINKHNQFCVDGSPTLTSLFLHHWTMEECHWPLYRLPADKLVFLCVCVLYVFTCRQVNSAYVLFSLCCDTLFWNSVFKGLNLKTEDNPVTQTIY